MGLSIVLRSRSGAADGVPSKPSTCRAADQRSSRRRPRTEFDSSWWSSFWKTRGLRSSWGSATQRNGLRPLLQMAGRTSGIAVPEGPLDPLLWRLRGKERGEEEEEAEGVEEMVEEVTAQLLFMMSLYTLLTVSCSPILRGSAGFMAGLRFAEMSVEQFFL